MMTVAGFGIPPVASPIHGGQLSIVIEGKRNKGKDKGKCIPSADFHGGRYPASCVNSTYAHPFLWKNTKSVPAVFTWAAIVHYA